MHTNQRIDVQAKRDILPGGIRCTKVKREAFHSMPSPHSHNCFELYYAISGQRKLVINQSIYELSKGDFAIIPPNTIHRTSYRSNYTHERLDIKFEDAMLEPLYKDPALGRERVHELLEPTTIYIPETHRAYAEELMMKIYYEGEDTDIYSRSMRQCYLLELILFIFRCKKAATPMETLDVTHESIQAAIAYIYEYYYRNLTLPVIANHFGMSSSYFSKKFKTVTGFGFKEYLTGVRIQKATELLLKTNDSITDIALSCGFNDSNNFGDAFRKIKGISPAKFRKNRGLI